MNTNKLITLDSLAVKHSADKASTHLGYTRHYDKFFEPMRDKPVKLLEIGVDKGNSCRMWLEYFPKGQIYGFDIKNHHGITDPRFHFWQGDQDEQEHWKAFIFEHGSGWDIIIDDGSHLSVGIINSFFCLWPHLKPGGLYCVEDLMVAYWPEYQIPEQYSQMTFVFNRMHDINQRGHGVYSHPETKPYAMTDIEAQLDWMHFSKGLAIFAKKE